MNEASARSPFAARSSQEQQEQWLCWQSQHMQELPLAKPTVTDSRSESVLNVAKPTKSRFPTSPGRSQYNAVVQRMRKATSRVQGYTSWPAVESAPQPTAAPHTPD